MPNVRKLVFGLVVQFCCISQGTAAVIYAFSGTTIGGGKSEAGLHQAFMTISEDFFSASGNPGLPPGYGWILPSDVVPGTCVGCDPELFGGVPAVAQFFPRYLTPPQDYIGFFVGSSLIEYVYNFPIGSFSAPGTYSTFAFGNPGTLTVTVTPEPSTLLCCLVALLSIVAVARTRDAQGESPF